MTAGRAVALHSALAAAAYAASAPLLASTLSAEGAGCGWAMMQVRCAFPSASGFDPVAYAALGTVVACALAWTRLRAHDRPWYPLVALFGGLALACIAYDVALRRDLVEGPKLVNDTFNTLRFAVTASLLLTFQLGRHVRMPLAGVVAATIASNLAVIAAAAVYVAFAEHLIGTARLFLLFVVYAFGGFGLHVMAIATLFSSSRMRDVPAAAR